MPNKFFAACCCALALAGCASATPKPFSGPNGRPAYSMRCSGLGRTLDACYQKAGELCPAGYTVVDRSSSTIAVPAGGAMVAAPRETLAIECR